MRKYGGSGDWSGGSANQLSFTNNGNLWTRAGSGDNWGTWNKLWHSGNFTPDNYLGFVGTFFNKDLNASFGNERSIYDYQAGNGNCTNAPHPAGYGTLTVLGTPDFTTQLLCYDASYGCENWIRTKYAPASTSPWQMIWTSYNSNLSTVAWNSALMTATGLNVNGNANVNGNLYAAGEIIAYSDRRLKSDIQPLTVRGTLKPVTYIKAGKPSIGFIAQDIKELYPELVQGNEDVEMLGVNYQQLTAVLYAEIIELKKKMKKVNKRIKKNNNRI